MPKERFFLESLLKEKELIIIEGDELNHLNVMRPKVKQQLEIVNGKGELGFGCLETIEKKKATILIKKVTKQPPEQFKVILAQAICRPSRLDFILEKSTELGVTDIWLFPGVHSEKKDFNEHQLTRMRAITISALKQCGRLYLPEITLKPSLEKFKELPSLAFFGDVNEDAPLFLDLLKETKKNSDILFFIGPETGFNDKETNRLVNFGAKGVKISKNILRTDTAAITALALIGSQVT